MSRERMSESVLVYHLPRPIFEVYNDRRLALVLAPGFVFSAKLDSTRERSDSSPPLTASHAAEKAGSHVSC